MLQLWLDDKSRNAPLVLDVRESWEYEICHIEGSQSLPMREIPARANRLARETDIVLVCHHGMRSLQAANYLARTGFSCVYNLIGGIAAWAELIDPAMPRY